MLFISPVLAILLIASVTTTKSTKFSILKKYVFNGLVDRIYDQSLEDVGACLSKPNDFDTPCPAWDTACYCVFKNYNDEWLECVARKTPQYVKHVEDLATTACMKIGVTWGKGLQRSCVTDKFLDKAKKTPQEQMRPRAEKMIVKD